MVEQLVLHLNAEREQSKVVDYVILLAVKDIMEMALYAGLTVLLTNLIVVGYVQDHKANALIL